MTGLERFAFAVFVAGAAVGALLAFVSIWNDTSAERNVVAKWGPRVMFGLIIFGFECLSVSFAVDLLS